MSAFICFVVFSLCGHLILSAGCKSAGWRVLWRVGIRISVHDEGEQDGRQNSWAAVERGRHDGSLIGMDQLLAPNTQFGVVITRRPRGLIHLWVGGKGALQATFDIAALLSQQCDIILCVSSVHKASSNCL